MTILASLPALAPVAAAQNDLLSRIFVFDRYGELLHMLPVTPFLLALCWVLIGGFGRHFRDDARPCLCGARRL